MWLQKKDWNKGKSDDEVFEMTTVNANPKSKINKYNLVNKNKYGTKQVTSRMQGDLKTK